jgi:hypothetical protein
MEHNCIRGQWRFCANEDPELYADFENIDWFNPPDRFWAQKENGVRVSRFELNVKGADCIIRYFGPNFVIQYTLLSVFNLEKYSLDEITHFYENVPNSDVVKIFPSTGWTKIDTISQSQFSEFINDAVDTNLYKCLFECVPNHWHNMKPLLWEHETLYQPIDSIQFAQGDFPDVLDFIRKKIDASPFSNVSIL